MLETGLEKLQEHCNSRNVNDKSLMNYAVKCGHPEIIRSIQQKIVLMNPEFVENLHMAVKNEDANCVKEQLEDQDLGVQEKNCQIYLVL